MGVTASCLITLAQAMQRPQAVPGNTDAKKRGDGTWEYPMLSRTRTEYFDLTNRGDSSIEGSVWTPQRKDSLGGGFGNSTGSWQPQEWGLRADTGMIEFNRAYDRRTTQDVVSWHRGLRCGKNIE